MWTAAVEIHTNSCLLEPLHGYSDSHSCLCERTLKAESAASVTRRLGVVWLDCWCIDQQSANLRILNPARLRPCSAELPVRSASLHSGLRYLHFRCIFHVNDRLLIPYRLTDVFVIFFVIICDIFEIVLLRIVSHWVTSLSYLTFAEANRWAKVRSKYLLMPKSEVISVSESLTPKVWSKYIGLLGLKFSWTLFSIQL